MNVIKVLLSGFFLICVLSAAYILFSFIFAHSSKKVHVLDVDEFEKHLTATNGEQLIDVRTPREFKKYRIAGAKNMEYPGVDFRRQIQKLDKSKPVLVYCHSGYRSKMVIPIFCKAGFKTICELNIGFKGWMKAEKPIEEARKGASKNFIMFDISNKNAVFVRSFEHYVFVVR